MVPGKMDKRDLVVRTFCIDKEIDELLGSVARKTRRSKSQVVSLVLFKVLHTYDEDPELL